MIFEKFKITLIDGEVIYPSEHLHFYFYSPEPTGSIISMLDDVYISGAIRNCVYIGITKVYGSCSKNDISIIIPISSVKYFTPYNHGDLKENRKIKLNEMEIDMKTDKQIEIYKIKEIFNSPLESDNTKVASDGIGDYLLIIEDEVWIRNWDDNKEDNFSKVVYSADFVRINPTIFEKQ